MACLAQYGKTEVAKLDTSKVLGQEDLIHQMWKPWPQTKPRRRQAKGLGASAHYVAPGWFSCFSYQTE